MVCVGAQTALLPSASRGAEEYIQEVEEPLHVTSVEDGGVQQ